MLFDTVSTQAAEASLDSLWLSTKVIANNMANESTPGFKAQRVAFDEVLSAAARAQKSANKTAAASGQQQQVNQVDLAAQTNQGRQAGANFSHFRSRIITDSARSERPDGNNVSLEHEQAVLWKNYAQYSFLLDKVQSHYSSINTAVSNMRV